MRKEANYFYSKFKEVIDSQENNKNREIPSELLSVLSEYIDCYDQGNLANYGEIIKNTVTATFCLTGEEYLKAIVKIICVELKADFAFIGTTSKQDKTKIKTLSFSQNGKDAPNFEYLLSDSPCEQVFGKTIKTYTSGISKLFPKRKGLKRMKVEGYSGMPLFNSKNEPIGTFVVMFCNPIETQFIIESVLEIFGVRISSEIDRIEAEKLLRESEKRFQHITETIIDYLVKNIISENNVVKTIHSKSCFKLTGYTQEEYENDPYLWFDMIYEDDRKYVTDHIANVILGIDTKAFEHRICHKNGSIRWIRNNPVLFFNEDGKLVEYDAVLSDITELKQVELKMIENEKQYKLLFNEMNSGCALQEMIYDYNGNPLDYKFIEVNPAYENIIGFKKEYLIGRTIREIIPDYKNTWIDRFGIVAKTSVPEMFEDYIVQNDRYYEILAYSPKKNYFATITNDVTDRVKALTSLIESETRYRTLVELSPDAIVVYSDNKIIYINKQGYKLAGAKNASELIGMDVMKFVHPDYQNLVRERNRKAFQLEGFKSVNVEKLLKLNGKAVDVEVSTALIQYNNKPSIQVIIRDITDKKKSELALRRSEERFAMAMGAVNDGLFDWEINTNEIYFSPRNYTMLGYEPYEFEANHAIWDNMIHPDDKENNYIQFSKHLKGVIPAYEIEYRIKTKDGAYKWILERGKIIEKDSKNKPSRVIGIHTDIDFRKNIEENLRKEKDFISSLMQINPVGILTTNTDLDIVFANEQAMQMIGIKKNNEGKFDTPYWLINDLDGNELKFNEISIVKSHKTPMTLYDQRYQLRWDKNKRVCVSVNMHPTFNEYSIYDGTIYTITDITSQVDSEKLLRKAKENAEESDRLKSAFLANMSHEIRTPMNGIIGFSGLLSKEDITPDKRQKYIKIIQNSTNQLLTIITDILDISKLEAGQLTLAESIFNLNTLLDEILLQFEKDKKDKGRDSIVLFLRKGLKDEESEIYADKARLNQVLSNLLGNALKFTEQGTIEFGYTFNGIATLEFYVKDTGIGIPVDMQKIIFERFRQADDSSSRRFGGTGLGLAISRGLIELLKGKIWVDSNPDLGSVFFFTLPYKKMLPVGDQKTILHPAKETNVDWRNATILIVEDVFDNYLLLKEIIDETNAKILYAPDGKSGIEIVKNNAEITLVLMDIQLPDMNGYEVTKKMKQLKPGLKVIAQTAFGLSGDREKAMAAGCNEYIAKPIIRGEFISLINKFVAKNSKAKY
jgi:PAS domain S-box-containing protein